MGVRDAAESVAAGPSGRIPDYKKNFRAPATTDDRPQLLAAASVNLILTHSDFPRGKNLWIFVFKFWFEIFCIATTLYFPDACAIRNRKRSAQTLTAGRIITYQTKT